MSEDEFVVLVEHAGLVDSFDGEDREYVERQQLLEWLEREGVALLRERFLAATDEADEDEANDDDAVQNSSDFGRLARVILAKMIEKRWLSPLQEDAGGSDRDDDQSTTTDHEDDGCSYSQPELYALRLSTTDAYRIYIEKDSESTLSCRSWSGRSLLDVLKIEQHGHGGDKTPSGSSVSSSDDVTDAVKHMRIREKMWQDCFPTCSDGCRQLFFSFESPTVVLYATLGLNLISNGINSVPAFSRELRGMEISHEDRSVIIGFLSRAFPCE